MADQTQGTPQAAAAAALGGPLMGEISPFPEDSELPDHSGDIADIFGLGNSGEQAGQSSSSNSAEGGGASPPSGAPAAEGGEGQTQPATPPTPQPTPGQQAEPQAPAPQELPPVPAAAPAAPAQAQPSDTASLQALSAQVQALIAQNAQLQAQLAQGGAGQQAPQTGPAGQQQGQAGEPDPYMDYRLAIPDDVSNAIFNSDDVNTARNGMTHLVNSLSRIIHERVLQSVQERVLPQHLQQFQQQTQEQQLQERMRQEYFTAYPQHNDPGIRLIVAQEAQTMWTQNPGLSWDDTARNALGARVNQRLGLGTPVVTQQAGQQPAAPQPAPTVPPARPAAMMGGSQRQPQPVNEGDEITNILTAGGGF